MVGVNNIENFVTHFNSLFTGEMDGYPMIGSEYDSVERKVDESLLLQSDDLVTSEGTKIKISDKENRQ